MFNFAAFATHFLCVMAGSIAGAMIMAMLVAGRNDDFDE